MAIPLVVTWESAKSISTTADVMLEEMPNISRYRMSRSSYARRGFCAPPSVSRARSSALRFIAARARNRQPEKVRSQREAS